MSAARAFPVSEIMIPRESFIRAADAADAKKRFIERGDIDMLPIPLSGEPTHVIFRDELRMRDVSRAMFISDSTPIFTLARLFRKGHAAYFVLRGRSIAGLVHISDLNNPLCKIPYFALIELLERSLLAKIAGDAFTEEEVRRLLGAAKAKAIFRRARHLGAVLPSEAAAMLFSDLLMYLCKQGTLTLSEREIETLNEFRNRVAHAGRRLLEGPDDQTLVIAESLCFRLLRRNKNARGTRA